MRSLGRTLSNVRDGFTSIGWWRDRVFVPYIIGTLTRVHPFYPGYDEAVHVMEEDWDNLVILDACRADVFEEIVDLDEFDSYSRTVSLGSHSSEWTRRNFQGRTFADTVYVSANPHTSLLDDGTFHELVEVWRDYECRPNMIDPDEIVEVAIETHERFPEKRLIVHFMQPHGSGGLAVSGPYEEAYRDTIEGVLPVVLEMLDQIDGKSVITADHGELFSRGLKATIGIDQHKSHLRLPALVEVPWAVRDGTRRSVTAGDVALPASDRDEIKARLRDLGYH